MGDVANAVRLVEEQQQEAERLGSAQGIALARFGSGLVYAHVPGRLAEARGLLEDGVAAYRSFGHVRFEGLLLCGLADVEHRLGDIASSLAHAALAVERLRDTPSLLAWALALQARALLAHGQVADAVDAADRSVAVLDRAGGGQTGGDHLPPLALAEALTARGDSAAARIAIADARRRLLQLAAALDGTPWRDSYLAMPDAARTLQLASQWIDMETNE